MATPKLGWANVDFVGTIERALGVPVHINTDTNAAALGEHCWGAARGLDSFIYLTVGARIGGSGMVNGRLMHGLMHPEMGHIHVPHDWNSDPYPGFCPYHGDCLEGLAAAPELWTLEAHYLALGLANFICTLTSADHNGR